jgi:hypothetical protein
METLADADRDQAPHRLAGTARSVRWRHARPHLPRCRATSVTSHLVQVVRPLLFFLLLGRYFIRGILAGAL